MARCQAHYVYTSFVCVGMLVLYQTIPLISHRGIILCLVVSRFVQGEIGSMVISTIAFKSDQFGDKHAESLGTRT